MKGTKDLFPLISFWGEDLTKLEGFEAAVCTYLTQINENGTYAVMKTLLK